MAEPRRASAPGKAAQLEELGAGIAVLLVIIFIVQNSQKVEVKFLFINTNTPLIFALLIAAILGAVIG